MNEDAMNRFREVAWHDTLTTEEQTNVERLASMPPAMAVAYVYVEFKREMNELREEHAEAMKTAKTAARITNFGSVVGGVVIAGAAYVAHAMGLDKVIR